MSVTSAAPGNRRSEDYSCDIVRLEQQQARLVVTTFSLNEHPGDKDAGDKSPYRG